MRTMAEQRTQRSETADSSAEPEMWLVALRLADEHPHRARRWLQITGVLSILAGAAAIAVPAIASVAIAIFIGWMLVFSGVVMGIHAFRLRSRRTIALSALDALLALLVGLYLIVFPLSGTV